MEGWLKTHRQGGAAPEPGQQAGTKRQKPGNCRKGPKDTIINGIGHKKGSLCQTGMLPVGHQKSSQSKLIKHEPGK